MNGPTESILQVQGLSKSFGGVHAVAEASFRVSQGTIHGLIGPNGAGKSTILNLLNGLVKADAGSVRYQGVEICGWPPFRVAQRGIGRTFQVIRCFKELSLLDNVLVGGHTLGHSSLGLAALGVGIQREEAALRERALEALRLVGLEQRTSVLAGALSFGELRLLELARAVVARPRLLLLDEPASGLSKPERRDLAGLLLALKQEGMTILVVEHDMLWLMPLVDQLVVLDYGRVIAEGAPDQVKRDPRVIEAYLGGGREGMMNDE